MYERYEPSDKVFVDREEYLEWMDKALQRCKEKSVVLHLRGIGGIGKSSLLDYWKKTLEATIVLDCQQYTEFYDRLNVLAKGAVLLGFSLPRFDVLWQIRQRFVQGVEPVKESGRAWAKEVITAIPFIGSLASIGSAISAVGAKVTPILKGKYGTIGKWLQEKLGKNHIEQLLEILWKDPRHSEFLYLTALLEDVNDRKNLAPPVLFLFDHFEYVDSESTYWRYAGKEITETELWCVFLSSLQNCVGVMASRRPAIAKTEIGIEESELTELDRESCIELLDLRQITDSDLQERIVSVSGGNPFVIGTLCDMAETGTLSLGSVDSMRADTLEGVRLKTWRRLFGQVQGLQGLVNRAGLLHFFDRHVMNIITPDMDADQWARLTHLSFVKKRGDGTYVLHDLARDLVIAELGERFHTLANEVEKFLEDASEDQDDKRLLGLSISVQGLHSPDSAIEKVLKIAGNNSWRFQFRSAVELLNSIKFGSLREQTIISLTKAWHLTLLDRVAEAEHILKESVEILEELAEANPKENQIHLLDCFLNYGVLLHRIKQSVESEAKFERALQISRDIDPTIGMNFQYVIGVCWWYSSFLRDTHRLSKASALLRWALDLIQIEKVPSIVARNRALTLYKLGDVLYFGGKPDEAETACKDALDTETEDVIKLNSLRLLGDIYLRTSRPYEAKRMLEESLGLIREISKREKGVHQVQPTSQLRHYALALKLLGNYSEAEVHYKDALEVSRESVDDAAEVYLPVLSRVLNDFAILYYEMYQYSKAGEYYKEALENYEKLSRDWPEGFEKYVAWTLNNYSIVLRETGEVGKARKYYRKALDIGRDLARKYPESVSNSHLLGVVLNNLGILYRKANNNSQAEEALREAYEIRQTLAKTTPAYFLTTLTTTLNNLGVVLAVTNRLSDAQEIFLQALEHRRKLVEKSPEMHNHGLACILNNLGNINKLTDEHPKARKYYLEGREILEKLVLNTPSVYKRCLTIVLSNLLLLHDSTGETEKAENIKAKLREMGASEIPNKEVWIEEEDAEADAH